MRTPDSTVPQTPPRAGMTMCTTTPANAITYGRAGALSCLHHPAWMEVPPGQYPQNTRAPFREEAVRPQNTTRVTSSEPNTLHKTCESRNSCKEKKRRKKKSKKEEKKTKNKEQRTKNKEQRTKNKEKEKERLCREKNEDEERRETRREKKNVCVCGQERRNI